MKITKHAIVTEVTFKQDSNYKRHQILKLFNQFIDFLKQDILGANCSILISGIGKLTPKLKKGGRIVRNPITGKEKVMADIATVTLTRRFKPQTSVQRFTELQLTSAFFNSLEEGSWSKNTVQILVSSFFNSIRKVNDSEHAKLEIRNFGLFSTKLMEERLSRNPKTNELVIVDEHIRTHFRISTRLKTELYEALSKIDPPAHLD